VHSAEERDVFQKTLKEGVPPVLEPGDNLEWYKEQIQKYNAERRQTLTSAIKPSTVNT
jgi:hypothetical protein